VSVSKRDPHAQTARQISHQRAVFIVGMGHDDEHAGRGAEPLEGLLEIGGAAVFGQRERVRRRLGQRDLRQLGASAAAEESGRRFQRAASGESRPLEAPGETKSSVDSVQSAMLFLRFSGKGRFIIATVLSKPGQVRLQWKKSNRRSFDSSACGELAQDDRPLVRMRLTECRQRQSSRALARPIHHGVKAGVLLDEDLAELAVLAEKDGLQADELKKSARNMAMSARSDLVWLSRRRSATGLSSMVRRRVRNWIIWPTVTESSSTLRMGRLRARSRMPLKDAHEVGGVGGDLRLGASHRPRNSRMPGLVHECGFEHLFLVQHLRGVLEALVLEQPIDQLAARIFGRVVGPGGCARQSILLLMWMRSAAV
jgi:hypothetical protein